jgi:hypothetical protein
MIAARVMRIMCATMTSVSVSTGRARFSSVSTMPMFGLTVDSERKTGNLTANRRMRDIGDEELGHRDRRQRAGIDHPVEPRIAPERGHNAE